MNFNSQSDNQYLFDLQNQLIKYLLCIALGVIAAISIPSIPIGVAIASLCVGLMNALEVSTLKKQNEKDLLEQRNLHLSELKNIHVGYCLHLINSIKPSLGIGNFELISTQLETIENALLACKSYCGNKEKVQKFINQRTRVRQWLLSFSLNNHGKTIKKSLTTKETKKCIEFLEELIEFLKDECN